MLVWDWKAWLGPHLRELQGFKDFRAFWFQLDPKYYEDILSLFRECNTGVQEW
jgi:hypothetical protein